MSQLDGKRVIVAGAGQGVGQAVAQRCAREGAQVLAVDINAAGLESTAQLAREDGNQILTQVVNVAERSQVDAAVAHAATSFGGVDVIVNTVMVIKVAPLEEQTESDLRRAFDVMVLGTFNLMQAAFPYLKEHGGRIINFGSGSGTGGAPTHSTYATAKEAVRGLTKVAANEWGRFQITSNIVIPAAATPSFTATVDAMGEGALDQLNAMHPMGRIAGDPLDDIAPLVVFLASDGANYINGRSIFVDGGFGNLK